MDKKEFKKVTALVFIKGYKQFPESKGKTHLARQIVKDSVFKNSTFNKRTLLNYFNHFFWESENRANPNDENLSKLLHYINFQSERHFIENQPSDESYLNNVPFSKNLERKEKPDIKLADEINNKVNESNEIKQVNILSGFNFSILKKVKGKIKQLNFLGFSNKQEVDCDEKNYE